VINTETEQDITQLMLLCVHNKPSTATWLLALLSLCNSLGLLE